MTNYHCQSGQLAAMQHPKPASFLDLYIAELKGAISTCGKAILSAQSPRYHDPPRRIARGLHWNNIAGSMANWGYSTYRVDKQTVAFLFLSIFTGQGVEITTSLLDAS